MKKNTTSPRPYCPWARAFPHSLKAITDFYIVAVDRWLGVYNVIGNPEHLNISLYWEDNPNPLQHNMSAGEVMNVVSFLLDPSNEEEVKRCHGKVST